MNTDTIQSAIAPSSASISEAAKTYLAMGWKPVPVQPKSKKPAISGWPEFTTAPADVEKHFSPNGNISIVLGSASGGIVCVDIDHPVALLITKLLPKTNRIHGRAGMPSSHYWYQATGDGFPSTQFKHPDGTMIVEILGDKRNVVVPPSVHKSGEKIVWEANGEIGKLPFTELTAAVAELAAGTLLAHFWPKKGARNETALALSGMLLRAGWSKDDVEEFIRAVAIAANDEEHEARAACAKTTAEKLHKNEPVTGAPRLKELVGSKIVERVISWLNIPSSMENTKTDSLGEALAALNKCHAVVQVGGSTAILSEEHNPATGRPTMVFGNESDLRLRYKNRRYQVPDPSTGKPRDRSLADLWLEWPLRRQFDGIEFNPSGTTPGYLNIFRGFAVEPKAGDCDRYLKHVKNVICGGNQKVFDYVIRWMAHAIQKPSARPETALVLRGRQGTGKGVFADNFGALFGDHYLTLYRHGQATGRFNSHLKDVLLLHLNEAIWGGQKDAVGMLKGLVTDPTIPIEAKGKDIFTVRNYMRLIVASNESWAVPVDLDDRRFLILDVSDAHKEDHSYFAQLQRQMKDDGGLAALMHHLQTLDLSNFNVRKMPSTGSMLEMKLQSADPVKQWWFHKLKESGHAGWTTPIQKAVLHEEYMNWCAKYKEWHPLSLELFSKQLKKLVPGLGSAKITHQSHNGGTRVTYFKLPSLKSCRKSMEQLMKETSQIWA